MFCSASVYNGMRAHIFQVQRAGVGGVVYGRYLVHTGLRGEPILQY